MNVLVLGASSQIGQFLLPMLAAKGIRIFAVSRRASGGSSANDHSVSWIQAPAELDSHRHSITAMVSCGPLAVATDWFEALPQLDRCIAFSSSSVHTKQTSEITALREAEEKLRHAAVKRQTALCLLQPTLIYGCGMDRNISQLYTFGKRWRRIPVSRRADGLRQPIHAEDLALGVINALSSSEPIEHEGAICGGSTLSYRSMVELTAAVLPFPVQVLNLSPVFFRLVIRALCVLPAWKDLEPGMVDRQAKDLVFDDQLTRERLGLSPRKFAPKESDFRIPESAASLQLPFS